MMRVAEIADVYSPRFGDALNQSLIETAHRQRMRVIPWTVNEPHEICEVARMGADGVITDFPARAKETAALVATVGRRPKKCP
jgi:glycerophosphoryl diester phosphodiesterase